MGAPNQLDAFDDGLILQESGQNTADGIHSLWLAVNSVLQRPRQFVSILDQWQLIGGVTEKLRQGAADRVKLAQGIQLANTGTIVKVLIVLIKTGAPTGNVWLTIEGDSSGDPSGSPLAQSSNYDVSTVTTAGSVIEFTFTAPASVIAGQQYHIVLQGDYTASAVNYVSWTGTSGNNYPGGSSKKFDAAWGATATALDFNFRVITQVRTS